MKPKTIAFLIVLALFLFILLQNMVTVQLNLLFWSITMPKLALIMASVFLGWLVGWFSHVSFQTKKANKKLRKQTAAAESTAVAVENTVDGTEA
ncbi:MAG: lipopolysaccharide assembly protein LapA domain-containing protein [bacterium]